MLALATLLATSADPKVVVTFANAQDAIDLGLPGSFNTTLELDWSSYDCKNVATRSGEMLCDRTQMACMAIQDAGKQDVLNFVNDTLSLATTSPTPVPIRIV